MSRLVTEDMAQALRDGKPRGLFIAIEHPDGTGYFWTGVGSREWDGHTWNGAGTLGSITPIKHSSEIAIQEIEFKVSGIDATLVSQLNDEVRNLNGSVWLACFGEDDSIIDDPYQLIDSELDYQVFDITPDGIATITIIARSGFYTLDRGVEEAWTPENQELSFPTDTGLDMIPSLQNQDLQWTPS